MSPLDRIKDYLSQHGLDLRVRVRMGEDGSDFILEDDCGFVHVRDYEEAIFMIDRMWL